MNLGFKQHKLSPWAANKIIMSVVKPYKRLWRPLKGYDLGCKFINDDKPAPSTDYIGEELFACQAELESLVTTAHLIIRDLYEVFNYVEPHEDNMNAFSHRIYELFLRTATEFESNCKGILLANGYKKNKMNAEDYFKIARAARLSEYAVTFSRWSTAYEFRPFGTWNSATYAPLTWYQDYNDVKHNRYAYFCKANFGNLMNSVAGLLCILHAQIGEFMDKACFEGFGTCQSNQTKVSNDTFTIYTPEFPEEEQYDFIWDNIANEPDIFQKYNF